LTNLEGNFSTVKIIDAKEGFKIVIERLRTLNDDAGRYRNAWVRMGKNFRQNGDGM
jgi:hypothetical protein